MQLRRKIIAFVFMMLISAPTLMSVFMEVKQRIHQYEMREKLEQSMLSEIVVPAEQLHWVKPGKEILFEGQLFDVHQYTTTENGDYLVAGLFDWEEDQLEKEMASLEKNKQGTTAQGKLLQWMSLPAIISETCQLPGLIPPALQHNMQPGLDLSQQPGDIIPRPPRA